MFNEERNIDFHGILWVRENGNVLIDPMPMSEHDLNHLENLGGAAHLLITNSDHVRDAPLEWVGDLIDLQDSNEMIPRYIRSLVKEGETLEEASIRLS